MIRKGIIVTRDGMRLLGGRGSGNFGHAGIPGQRGGSTTGGGGGGAIRLSGDFEAGFNSANNAFKEKNGKILQDPNINDDLKQRAIDSGNLLKSAQEMYKADLQDPSGSLDMHWVTVGDKNSPDGFGYIKSDTYEDSISIEYIGSLNVTKPGTGSAVIDYAKNLAREKGIKKITLSYSKNSKQYYEKKGFTVDGGVATYEL